MSSSRQPRSFPLFVSFVSLGASLMLGGCRSADSVPKVDSKGYLAAVSAFYSGLAGLQVGDDVRAEASLAEAARLAPGEPAAWVNWGVLALRQRSYDAASSRLQRAHRLAPGDDQIDYLVGLLESNRGNSTAAISAFEEAVKANPRNLRALYALASEVERQGGAESEERFQRLMQQILAIEPGNLAAELELSRIAAKRGDVPVLKQSVSLLGSRSSLWPAEVTEQLTQLRTAADGAQPRSAATRSLFLRNVMMRLPEFRIDLSDLKPQPGEGAQPMTHFLKMANLSSRPSAADMALTFTESASNGAAAMGAATWAGAIDLNGEDAPVLAEADAQQVHLATGATLPFPGAGQSPSPEGVLPIDFNYDFKVDLALAGAGGVRLFRQEDPAHFTDVTASTKLPAAVLNAAYTGAWALDIEADGDLDILLGSATGAPTLLRNNGDGSFTVTHPFEGISGVRQLCWIDLNGDGNPDAAILDGAQHVHVFLNQRSGNFKETASPLSGVVKAVAIADTGSDSMLNVVAVQQDGAVVRLVAAKDGGRWASETIATVANAATELAGEVRLHGADLDNNGAVDLVLAPVAKTPAATTMIWLQGEDGKYQSLAAQNVPALVFDVADLERNGHLALVGLDAAGAPVHAESHGTRDYHWQTIRPRARQATGDQRINSFGVGGEIEVRSGLLVQKQPIVKPDLHFGLGEFKQAEVARILWPNGSVRAEFNLKADQQVVTEQRLKGSCPFLFAWNGSEMAFVKDSVPWGSAIGLRINALGTASIAATEEWYKIGRDQLRARNGFYDLRITGELWETYYYDSMALMTVDHPAGTEVFTDERYDVPPVKLAVTAVEEPQPVAHAVDDEGHDVTATVAKLDGVYLDNFGRGQYQGVTRDHFVEIELPAAAAAAEDKDKPLWLIARGWLHPSDSSVNVAMGQGAKVKPTWLSLEVPDGHGGWRVAKPNLGFPAGRNKICLIDLAGVFRPGEPHRMRLRTNLEVYWDQIQWAQGAPAAPVRIQRLNATDADLHYRGFSVIHQANASSPELPAYNEVAGTTQRWRDLEGFYTRFGDVRELLAKTDDRYVIMNAGDEMSLRYRAPAPPPAGWVRDFVIAGDGWIKDGDYNSSYSRTVLPYPYHARRDYDSPPTRLEDDWVYRHHPEDWLNYQTRYVTPDAFVGALRDGSRGDTGRGQMRSNARP